MDDDEGCEVTLSIRLLHVLHVKLNGSKPNLARILATVADHMPSAFGDEHMVKIMPLLADDNPSTHPTPDSDLSEDHASLPPNKRAKLREDDDEE